MADRSRPDARPSRIGLDAADVLPANRRVVRRSSNPEPDGDAQATTPAAWTRLAGRSFRALAGLLGLAAAAGGVALLVRVGYRFVHSSPRFSVRTVDFVSEPAAGGRLSRGEALRAAGIALGRNVFQVVPAVAQARLERLPWVRSARVGRRLPGTIEVRIVERRAVALVQLGSLYLVDEEGTVFKRWVRGDPVDLPVLTGILRAEFETDRPRATERLREMLGLTHDYERAGLAAIETLSEIHRESDGSLTIFAARDGAEYRLGLPPFRDRLRQLAALLGELNRRGARAEYVYLDGRVHPDRATVRLAPSGSTAPTAIAGQRDDRR